MNRKKIILELSGNKNVFRELLSGLSEEEYLWRFNPDKWCLLEIVCHLYDEEREDFRARTKHTLETPYQPLPPIDPPGWVNSRKYIDQDYNNMFAQFLEEREKSIRWLKSLKDPNWDNAHQHPKFGAMPAKLFLTNWLAHDYLHIRQIIKLKFEYLKQLSGEPLNYAGDW